MAELLPLSRPRPHGPPVHVRYEKAGQLHSGPPVPWSADGVLLEVLARLPPAARYRPDFMLRLPGREPVAAESLRRDEGAERVFRLVFRLPTPAASTTAEILWKHRLLASVPLPVQTADQYLSELRLHAPTVSVRLGTQSVAASTFVANQCRGLIAATVLRSPTGLAPLADLGVSVAFRHERSRAEQEVVVPLAASQLSSKEALLVAALPKLPLAAGDWAVTWRAAGRPLFAQRVTAISAARFTQSLRVADARWVVADGTQLRAVRTPPLPGGAATGPVGPCFVLASREPGAAGLVSLEVVAVSPGTEPPSAVMTGTVLVTDGPTLFTPGLLDAAEAAQVGGFELRHKGKVLGTLSLRPVPAAAFDSEGSFKPPADFAWNHAADEELTERLMKLMKPEGSE